jgi:DNA-binding protein HU-beta
MNPTELIDRISSEAHLTKAEAGDALDAVINAITGELEAGGDVRLPRLGIFSVVERPARPGRNPQTGEAIMIAAKRQTKFKEVAALKEALNPVRLTGSRRMA